MNWFGPTWHVPVRGPLRGRLCGGSEQAYRRSRDSVDRWMQKGCAAVHYVIRPVRGREVLVPCRCMGIDNRTWRRNKMQRRLGMNEG